MTRRGKLADVTDGPTTTKGERSKARLVAATAELLQRQGYHATGLSQIVDESGAPRGSLYFYFPGGKEELACAALADAGVAWRARIEAAVAGTDDLGAAVVAVCREFAGALEASGWEHGCPLATVALEAATSSEAVRTTCADHFVGWERAIAARLVATGVDAARATELALFTLATIEGALLLAKVERSTRPLDVAGRTLQMMVAMITPPRPAATAATAAAAAAAPTAPVARVAAATRGRRPAPRR